jgi:polyketide-type polyunsaturated fatty acid synthase PfaA
LLDPDTRRAGAHVPIAIVGMACIFPEARNLREFWDNVVKKRDCITDVPESRWKIADYYDPDPTAPDKTYSKRGGFIPDVDFDPVEFGLPPNVLEVTDNTQLLALLVAKQTLADAGYGPDSGRALDRERTGIVLGVGSGLKLITPLTSRLQGPVWEEAMRSSGLSAEDAHAIAEKAKLAYIPWEENSFPGMLGNVISGRVANRLDLGGINCTVDAACASSLAAMRLALAELTVGNADSMLVGGVDADNSPFMYLCFSKTPAFTKGDRIRPFDASSDGMMVGEGVGMLLLKRLADAERDGDRVYAVVRGMGASSDGRYKSIYAPRSEGQQRALERAYAGADVELDTVGLIEAHGTGTVAGDLVEVGTLRKFFEGKARRNQVALGSVKSQIGHTKSAAGAAGLIKAALALHHKVLPPTINVTEPHPAGGFGESPLYLNTETRPWLGTHGAPRRAGVSSFGFGGTNFHVVLEEHEREHALPYRLQDVARPVVVDAPTPEELVERCRQLVALLDGPEAETRFDEVASAGAVGAIPSAHARLGFAAESAADARAQLELALAELARRGDAEVWEDRRGISYRRQGLDLDGRVVALFPGQGSQYVDMGRELAANFPEPRVALDEQDALFIADGQEPLSQIVYPPPAFGDDGGAREAELRRTEHAQPALGALSAALYRILRRTGFEPAFLAGHSFGELTALWAAGALTDADFARLARARGRAMAPPNDPCGPTRRPCARRWPTFPRFGSRTRTRRARWSWPVRRWRSRTRSRCSRPGG